MAYREFFDLDGVLCKVWDTFPTATNQRHVSATLADGWLAFECGERRLRLSPVPAAWESAPEHQLRYWLSVAEPRPRKVLAADPVEPLPEPSPAEGGLGAVTRAIVERSRRTLATIQRAMES
jgi:hypothetical protein